ncbi:hypothetical protein [Glutamicibacter arilaitensis]|uniref:hypothetical protein n=1 Tax=Glutamicibacter arilaitensis TaxID=256701 RepID=UPI00384F19A0
MPKSRFLRVSVAVSISSALVLTPLAANAGTIATPTASTLTSQSVSALSGSLTASDWKEVAKRASAASDVSSARVANTMAAQKTGSTNVAQPANIITTLAKKAAIAALRYSSNKIPAKMRPYANKIANFLEDLENWQEGPIITGLMALGVPYDVASAVATWVVVFGGI